MHTDWKAFERNRRPVGYDHHVVSKKLIADCEKSKSTNLNPYIINWIISFLGNCKKRVVMDGKITDYVDINKGVPQGTVLGPLLFSLIVNDIKLVDSSNPISNCADDFTIRVPVRRESDTELAKDKYLKSWAANNRMSLNLSKTWEITTKKTIKNRLMPNLMPIFLSLWANAKQNF